MGESWNGGRKENDQEKALVWYSYVVYTWLRVGQRRLKVQMMCTSWCELVDEVVRECIRCRGGREGIACQLKE